VVGFAVGQLTFGFADPLLYKLAGTGAIADVLPLPALRALAK
jgi:hypothetical protein